MKKNEIDCFSLIRKCRKIYLLKMKLLGILILAGAISVSANSYSRKTKLDIVVRNSSIKEILKEIENTSEFNSKKHNLKSFDALKIGLVAIPDEKRQVKGTIKDGQGLPMAGATIVVKGTTSGIVADVEGNFTMQVPVNAKTLIFSFVGMKTQEVAINGKTSINVVLEAETIGIDEVVTVGYVTQKREELTGAISVIKGVDLENRTADSPVNLLYGLAAGVAVNATTGIPGSTANVEIHGSSSWGSGGNEPLIVIDGVIREMSDFSAMNADDIAGITVLKDAASTSMYGIRGGSGVFLVTTKQGKSGDAKFEFTSSFSTERPTNVPGFLSSYEVANKTNLLNSMLGRDSTYVGWYTRDELAYFKNDNYNAVDDIWRNPINSKHNLAVSGGSGDTKYYMSASHATVDGAIMASYGKNTFLGKVSGKINQQLKFSLDVNSSWVESKAPYIWSAAGEPDVGSLYQSLVNNNGLSPMLINGLPTSTNGAILTGDGGYKQSKTQNYNSRLVLEYQVPWVEGLFLKGSFSYSNRYGYGRQWGQAPTVYYFVTAGEHGHIITNELDYTNPLGYARLDNKQLALNGGERYALSENRSHYIGQQTNASINYDKTLGKHNIHAFVGIEEAHNEQRFISGSVQGFVDPTNDNISSGNSTNDVNKRGVGGGVNGQYGVFSVISRLDYNYFQKYIFGFTMRADESYKFPKSSRIGYFPSASAGWNIAKESFFAPLTKYIQVVKLRASYGLTGTDNTDAWQWQNNYMLGGSPVLIGISKPEVLSPSFVPNTLITWEKNYNGNIGVDLSLPKNLVSLSVDYWHKKTTDILGTRLESVPITVGAILPAVNYGAGKGWGWDFHVEHNNKIANLVYSVGVNIMLKESEYLIKDQAATTRDYLNQIGHPMNSPTTGYICEGIIKTQADLDRIFKENGTSFTILNKVPGLGDLMYKDIRGQAGTTNPDLPDGKITADDKEILGYKGAVKKRYSINLRVAWKGLSLSAIADGVWGRWATPDMTRLSSSQWDDMWSPQNIDGSLPIPDGRLGSAVFTNANLQTSTFWLREFPFLRMKNIKLDYTIPKKKKKKSRFISGVTVFASVENPFYIYNPNHDYDPEMGRDSFSYPILIQISGGVKVTV
jgi:TonB-linked SusC/RagA family outer membrane protein